MTLVFLSVSYNSTSCTAHVRIAFRLSNLKLKFCLVSSFLARSEVIYNVTRDLYCKNIRGVLPLSANFLFRKWVWSRCCCQFKSGLQVSKKKHLSLKMLLGQPKSASRSRFFFSQVDLVFLKVHGLNTFGYVVSKLWSMTSLSTGRLP